MADFDKLTIGKFCLVLRNKKLTRWEIADSLLLEKPVARKYSMTLSRVLSLLIFLGYIATVFLLPLPDKYIEAAGPGIGMSILGLALIWFGDSLSECAGLMLHLQTIHESAPEFLIKFIGWLMLIFSPWLLVLLQNMTAVD